MPRFLASRPRTSAPTRRRPVRRRPLASWLCLESLEARRLLSFSPAVSYPVGLGPQAVVTGDFHGTGKLDLAVSNLGNNTVSVLPGNGDGTFRAPQTFMTGASPLSLSVGDFNGDGKLDLVTFSRDVSVLLGIGNGTFQPPRTSVLPGEFPPGYTGTTALPQHLYSLSVGDFNGDGKLDLAISAYTSWSDSIYSYSSHDDAYVNVLLGNGDGSFTPKAAYLVPNNSLSTTPPALGLGDFNGDRKLDVVTVSTGGDGVSVWPGDGDGTLQAPVHSTSGTPFLGSGNGAGSSVLSGDLDGDGKLDLVTRSSEFTSVFVQKGNGDGTFQAPLNVAVGLPPATGLGSRSGLNSVVLGDVNGDGKLDMRARTIETHYGSGGPYGFYDPTSTSYASVLLGHGDGSFGLPTSSTLGSRAAVDSFSAATLADFNGDGRPDLAETDYYANTVSVALNGNDWASIDVSSFAVSGFPASTTAGVAGSLTVAAKNANGTTATNYTGTIHFSSSDSQAGLPANYTFTAADQGIHTFSAILKTAGTQSITATDTTTGSLTGSESGITVTPAAASSVTVAGYPSTVTAGVAGSLTVRLKDPYGNLATGYTGTVAFSSTDSRAVLPANYTFTATDAGVHIFSATLKTAGTQSIAVKDTVTGSITGTDSGITVNPAAASQFIISAPSSVTAGKAFSLTLTVKDAYGNVVTGSTGTVHFTSTDSTATLPSNYTFRAADKGVHAFTGLVLRKKGNQKLTITDTLNSALTGSVIENVL